MVESVDVLFIDEAGQMSLADALAASLSATNLVLLGDPQQLDQPLQGVHPPGADRSALAHVLHGRARDAGLTSASSSTGPGDSIREISAYTSEVFYEGRLHSHPGTRAARPGGRAAPVRYRHPLHPGLPQRPVE